MRRAEYAQEHSPVRQTQRPRGDLPPSADAPPYLPLEIARVVKRLEAVERALDRAFTIPGTRFRIGWDGIVGLIPGIGDFASLAPLGFYFAIARRYELGKGVYLRLLANQLIDFLVGSIPLAGDIFDIAFKANSRNANLLVRSLKQKFADRAHDGRMASDD